MRLSLSLLLILLLTACVGSTPEQEAYLTQHAVRSTTMADLRLTAAVEAERLQVTVQAVSAAGTLAQQRQAGLVSTLAEFGLFVDIGAIEPASRTEAPQALATAAAQPNISGGGITRIPPTPDFRTAPPQFAPTVPPDPPTINPNAPGLRGFAFATGVRDDNCPRDNVAQFPASVSAIYATAITQNLVAGTRIGVRWFQDGAEVAYYDILAQVDLNNTCVYIFVDRTDFPFTPGSQYRAAWELNGQPYDEPFAFAIVP